MGKIVRMRRPQKKGFSRLRSCPKGFEGKVRSRRGREIENLVDVP